MPKDPVNIKRKRLRLTWLHRVVSQAEREKLVAGAKYSAASALVDDGTLHVLAMQSPRPRGAPPEYDPPMAIHLTHIGTDQAALVAGAETAAPVGRGRCPTIPEIDEVVGEFARGRIMALLFSGEGIAEGPAFYELVQIVGAMMPQESGLAGPPV